MNKFLSALAALAVLAAPVQAEARHRDNNRSERHHNGNGVGKFVGGLIVGAIVGAAASNSRQHDRRYEDYNYPYERDSYRPQRVCFEEQIVEYRYGRKYVYYEYRCR